MAPSSESAKGSTELIVDTLHQFQGVGYSSAACHALKQKQFLGTGTRVLFLTH